MFLAPVGMEDSVVHRIPWTSIVIAALTLLGFVATWIVPDDPAGQTPPQLYQAVSFWHEHPYLRLDPRVRSAVTEESSEHPEALRSEVLAPSEDVVRDEQVHLDELVEQAIVAKDRAPLRKWGFVPARGIGQVGLLTYMFLHLGWLHLIGNLLFFYITAVFLEDVWGPWALGALYVVGGFAAAIAEYAFHPHWDGLIVGASGAIAACMGAFVVRFPKRRVRMAYFFWIGWRPRKGTFQIPSLVAGLAWLVSQLFDLWLSSALGTGGGGVALMAHIGGFGFGAAAAAVVVALKLEEKHLAPSLQGPTWELSQDVAKAHELVAQGQKDEARVLLQAHIAKRPNDLDALIALAEIDPNVLTAPQALRVAEQSPADSPVVERLLEIAAKSPGVVGLKALLRTAELRIERGERSDSLRQLIARVLAEPALSEALRERALAAQHAVAPLVVQPTKAIALGESAEKPLPVGPGVTVCQLAGVATRALRLKALDGRAIELDLGVVVGVCVGRLEAAEGPGGVRQGVVMTDLILGWGDPPVPPTVVRLPSFHLGVQRFYPALSPLDGWRALVEHVLAQSSASPLPSRAAASGNPFTSFADVSAFELACYGAALTPAGQKGAA